MNRPFYSCCFKGNSCKMVHSKALSGHEAEVDLVLVHLSFSYGDYA